MSHDKKVISFIVRLLLTGLPRLRIRFERSPPDLAVESVLGNFTVQNRLLSADVETDVTSAHQCKSD